MESNNSTPHLPAVEPSNITMPSSDAESSLRSQKGYHQRRQTKSKKDKSLAATDEVSNYLAMPVALEEENPLDWWRIRAKIFQNYHKLPANILEFLRLPCQVKDYSRMLVI
ncbi:hypothetical protein RhiirC2_829501 [Rhizophagus irregularis]|uniref:HAT C-terminal dimerisation domain-containing protein n=1 Tax=Rhizophagus irregularis TaxID=588596 RepID=A0A2N1NA38_9GLOM|nr:hypothetical protein RhiirC2_829501 [Rhizophagus irregularis]